MNIEFCNKVKKILQENPKLDTIDAMIQGFEEYATGSCTQFLKKLENIDEFCLFIRLYANYDAQVNNGGNSQFFQNGYASYESIDHGYFGAKSDDISIIDQMIDLVKKYLPMDNGTVAKYLTILQDFENHIVCEPCSNCDGEGSTQYEDEETGDYEYQTCSYCNGTGNSDTFIYSDEGRDLDSEYYDISQELLKVIDKVAHDYIFENTLKTNEITPEEPVKKQFDNNKPTVKLIGTDGNAFAIMAKVIDALRQAGQRDKIESFKKEAMSGDYYHLLATCGEYVNIK